MEVRPLLSLSSYSQRVQQTLGSKMGARKDPARVVREICRIHPHCLSPGAPSSYSCLYYMYFEAPWEKTLSDVGLGKAHAGGQRWCVLSTDGFFWLFCFCCCRLFVCFIFFCCFIDEFGERARKERISHPHPHPFSLAVNNILFSYARSLKKRSRENRLSLPQNHSA